MTRVAILWHMHQPLYRDLPTGEFVLPWARFHALRDYWGMAALIREFPSLKVTFNLVPSLLVQLEAYAAGTARDRHRDLGLKPADALSASERAFCLRHFFRGYRRTLVDPHPRYRELFERYRPDEAPATGASGAPINDIRDLQVWHTLAWIDPEYRERDARVRALVEKGAGFTETDKASLAAVEQEIISRVIPEYADAETRGQAELSTSPFYHPILPLLCDTDVHQQRHPEAPRPSEPFRHPDDAAEQIDRAVRLHRRLFGRAPAGLWPPEGGVSDAMLPLVAAAGFRWVATDEGVLAYTRQGAFTRDAEGHLHQPEVLYRPYRVGPEGQPLTCLFRDHTLSDLIGFRYASWDPQAAADDFLERVLTAGRRYTSDGGGEATIAVILDGENAWERYPGGGRPFLRALYGTLTSDAGIRTVTMREACTGADTRLPSLVAGSWINADFTTWIGHADHRTAWAQLAAARRALAEAAPAATPQALAAAREEILIAEGSDWLWWYGDEHSSDDDRLFDALFRRHLRNVYRALGLPVPGGLFSRTGADDRPEGSPGGTRMDWDT